MRLAPFACVSLRQRHTSQNAIVWNNVATKFLLPGYNVMISNGGPIEWVRYLNKIGTKEEKKQRLGILFSFWWRIWKERNKRIFEGIEQSVPRLTGCRCPL
jgi:hypothetical protein